MENVETLLLQIAIFLSSTGVDLAALFALWVFFCRRLGDLRGRRLKKSHRRMSGEVFQAGPDRPLRVV